jgi:hypothetical protein
MKRTLTLGRELVRKASAEARRLERLERKAAKRARHKEAPWRARLGMAVEACADVEGVTR